jgi:hypothetical protein
MILMASSCEPEPIEVEEPCKCEIKGTKQISFDYGATWSYNGLDGRTGLMFECSYDGIYTNQTYGDDGIYYRIFWECKD